MCVCEPTTAKVGQSIGQPEHTGVVTEGGRGEEGEDARRCENAQVSGCMRVVAVETLAGLLHQLTSATGP